MPNDWLQQVRRRTVDMTDHQEGGTGGGAPSARIVCWPHAGAPASVFQGLAGALPGYEVLGVQAPGRQHRFEEPLEHDPDTALRAVTAALAALPPPPGDRLVLLGHSLGAALAHRLAVRLGAGVDLLVVSGRVAPHRLRPRHDGKPAAELTDADLLDFLAELGTPDLSALEDPDVRAYALPVLRSDLTLGDALAALPAVAAPRAPVTVVHADRDPLVPDADAQAWAEVARVREHLGLSGGHFAFFDSVGEVAAAIRRGLAAPEHTDSGGSNGDAAARTAATAHP